MLTFKELYTKLSPISEDIAQMCWQCFGNNCYIMDNDSHSVYFDILTQKVYAVLQYGEDDANGEILVKIWVDPEYRDAYCQEGGERCCKETFVSTMEELL